MIEATRHRHSGATTRPAGAPPGAGLPPGRGPKYPCHMYAQFFGLKREPFSIAPDPRYLFMSERHREALAHLLYGINAGGGFVLLTGEIGAGKTTVCHCFLEQIPKRCNVAYIFNPKLTVIELLQSICDEFHIALPEAGPAPAAGHSPTIKDYVDRLNDFLLQAHAIGQNNILIIDEAQNLSPDVLEQLRLLTNLETSKRKLLQVILIGQPELRTMLERPELEQLAQRVIARYHLDALTEAETVQYIRHRLAVAGLPKASLFDRGAIRRIYRLSRGVPRRINLLCDRALLGGYAEGRSQVDRGIVEKAAHEMFGRRARRAAARRGRMQNLWLVGLGMTAGALVLGLLAWALSADLPRQVREARWPWQKAVVPASAPATTVADAEAAAQAPAEAASARAANETVPPDGPPSLSAGATAPITLAASLSESEALFKSLPRDEKQAWRELAPLWKVSLGSGDPCQEALKQQVRCFKNPISLATIRQLGRPGILVLRDDNDQPAYALLTGLTSQTATLRVDGVPRTVPLEKLAKLWRGDYATLWRIPRGYVKGALDDSPGPMADWLWTQLARAQGQPLPKSANRDRAALRARVAAFQRAHGLEADGQAGPTTLMQLNRGIGVDEPRLQTQ